MSNYVTKICVKCSAVFFVHKTRESAAKYCSRVCYWTSERNFVTKQCTNCLSDYKIDEFSAKRTKFCSKKCARHFHKKNITDLLLLVQEYLSYNPDTGILTWIKSPNPAAPLGSPAGYLTQEGYLAFKLKHLHFFVHVVSWALHHKKWPTDTVDHDNGVRSDNKLKNLRAATGGQNVCNQKPRSKSGYKGVYLNKDGTCRASIHIDGKNRNLGRYQTPEEANEVRIRAEKVHGIFEYCESGRKRANPLPDQEVS